MGATNQARSREASSFLEPSSVPAAQGDSARGDGASPDLHLPVKLPIIPGDTYDPSNRE